jgi:hypothetical protein
MSALLNMRMLVVAAIVLAVFALIGANAFAKQDGDTRPGWGYGDKNHTHTGPPGQSVRP